MNRIKKTAILFIIPVIYSLFNQNADKKRAYKMDDELVKRLAQLEA